MARAADPELRRWWRELIESFDPTRESVVEFCDRHEVSTASFYTWRRKLAAGAGRPAVGRVTPRRSHGTPHGAAARAAVPSTRGRPGETPAFLPVQVVHPQQSNCLRVHLAGGVSIELPVDQRQLLFDLVAYVQGDVNNDVWEAN